MLDGHPWVFANEVEALLPAEHDGEVVECRDRAGRLLGTGLYNSKSQIVWRRLSRERVALDEAYLRAALAAAIARRGGMGDSSAWSGPSRTACPGSSRTSSATRSCCRSRRSRWTSARR
ncbi:hypothetical protein [Oleiharenicola sp. Vm1]|uniref:hypothetical protein n=1 Tax=Oleiharenicola sp. Vm1 TaxID=3398393 RepID=UPI0039F605A7